MMRPDEARGSPVGPEAAAPPELFCFLRINLTNCEGKITSIKPNRNKGSGLSSVVLLPSEVAQFHCDSITQSSRGPEGGALPAHTCRDLSLKTEGVKQTERNMSLSSN
ncbi:hypothetical protein FQA47_021038 [Oryzias melastigma]|uniref:Uncharacterized protein n=1 Tax=Oryzias melastigma TaxID=30732 RepID=A0A834CHC5_ORYME|nr:hypothetical protein FQA47_021038 [Oryzias melastigma]